MKEDSILIKFEDKVLFDVRLLASVIVIFALFTNS